MASPQLENGYTRIANELLDAMLQAKLCGQEWQILLAIIRKTYGFGKKQDAISYGQIAEITGIPRARVIMRVKGLVSRLILGSLSGGTRKAKIFWINKDFTAWGSPRAETRFDSPMAETRSSPRAETTPSPRAGTHKRNIKKERKEPLFISPLLGELKNVKLTPDDLEKLETKFGKEETQKRIERLSLYIGSKGDKYKSHYATILNWARKDGFNGNTGAGGGDDNLFLRSIREDEDGQTRPGMGAGPKALHGQTGNKGGT